MRWSVRGTGGQEKNVLAREPGPYLLSVAEVLRSIEYEICPEMLWWWSVQRTRGRNKGTITPQFFSIPADNRRELLSLGS